MGHLIRATTRDIYRSQLRSSSTVQYSVVSGVATYCTYLIQYTQYKNSRLFCRILVGYYGRATYFICPRILATENSTHLLELKTKERPLQIRRWMIAADESVIIGVCSVAATRV